MTKILNSKQLNYAKDFAKLEQKILKFWEENFILKKYLAKNKGAKHWCFLDGPITANNPMGVHHAWGRTYKDIFQRYHAMKGEDQRFQNGFDCQGLWVEVEVEKELGFKTKKDIEKYGIAKFVEKCKERVRKYSQIQTEQSIRLGQFMDWPNSYYTYSDENNYAIWHFLKKCYQKGMLYKGRDVVPWCIRCGTAISQHEILTEEYQELTHKSVYVRFPIKGRKNEYLLVWTTTPWTLPANVAVAAKPDMQYLKIKQGNKFYYLAESSKKVLVEDYKIEEKILGKDLAGLKYAGSFDILPIAKNIEHRIILWDEISEEEGTGLVHIAPGCGQEDFALSKLENLPVIDPIDELGNYREGFDWLSGKNINEISDEICQDLEKRGFIYKIEYFTHRYPVCWRCKRELAFRLVDEWYIAMGKLRKPMMAIARKIHWIPEFGRERELDWLKNMSDWLISKKRYWGLALPIWECECKNFEVIGSKEELQKRAKEGWEKFEGKSPHRPWIDAVKIECSKCGKLISRIPDVGNPWLDAGIVPFSTLKYFEDKTYWKKWFPADFVCESFPGQFRNWFYSLIAMSTVLENREPVKTILGHGLVRDEKGEEMHKSKGNAIDFSDAAEKIGADTMRWLYASADPANNLLFGYHKADEVKKKFILILWNVYQFFFTYSKIDNWKTTQKPKFSQNILDRWIISQYNKLLKNVTIALEKYDAHKACKMIEEFVIDDLSTWYLRRSRKRRNDEFYQTILFVLINLIKILAPFMPFLSEDLYQRLKDEKDPKSVHLVSWPQVDENKISQKLSEQMRQIRTIAVQLHAQRNAAKIKVRQPLLSATIGVELPQDLKQILIDELNIKKVIYQKGLKTVKLNTNITQQLYQEGILREFIRHIQELRKKANLLPGQKVTLYLDVIDHKKAEIFKKFNEIICQETSLNKIIFHKDKVKYENNLVIDGDKIWLGINKL